MNRIELFLFKTIEFFIYLLKMFYIDLFTFLSKGFLSLFDYVLRLKIIPTYC